MRRTNGPHGVSLSPAPGACARPRAFAKPNVFVPRHLMNFQGGHGEKIDVSGIDGGGVDSGRAGREGPENSSITEHGSRYQRSGFEPASAKSSLTEKTVNCGELKAHGRGSDKVLADLRPVRDGVDCDQRQEVRPDSRLR